MICDEGLLLGLEEKKWSRSRKSIHEYDGSSCSIECATRFYPQLTTALPQQLIHRWRPNYLLGNLRHSGGAIVERPYGWRGIAQRCEWQEIQIESIPTLSTKRHIILTQSMRNPASPEVTGLDYALPTCFADCVSKLCRVSKSHHRIVCMI